MAFEVPSFEDLRDRYLQAVLGQDPTASVGPDSDHFVRASAIAAVAESILGHQAWLFRQIFPDLADDDVVERKANEQGLSRKPAAKAAGTVRFVGAAASALPLGQQVFTAQGVYFETTATAAIGGGGSVDVAARALVAGAGGNLSDHTPATVVAPPSGVTGAATVLSMTSGADVESTADLLVRLLLELSEQAQGGNAADYQRWALSVPGVARAYVFPVRRGAGTVDVVPMPATGMPSGDLLGDVQEVLDARRPVGMLPTSPVLALAPTAVPVNVTATMSIASGFTLGGLTTQLGDAVRGVFSGLAPGDTLIRNDLVAAVMNVDGVRDVTLSSPSGNTSCTVSSSTLQLLTLGTLSFA